MQTYHSKSVTAISSVKCPICGTRRQVDASKFPNAILPECESAKCKLAYGNMQIEQLNRVNYQNV